MKKPFPQLNQFSHGDTEHTKKNKKYMLFKKFLTNDPTIQPTNYKIATD